jgi:outer membrane protein OmpA-like peptidoglycan-associated protein
MGDASGMRAFVYGKRTVLEFPSRPLWLSIQDENGVAVPYEREGRYYRLPRQLDHFTVRANTRVLSFGPTSRQVPGVSTEVPAVPGPAPLVARTRDAVSSITSPVLVSAAPASKDDAAASLRLSSEQLDEVRRVIAAGAESRAEAEALNARIDRVEARLLTNASAMICVRFGTGATDFAPDEHFVRILVPAARAAERIDIRGRTDARIAGTEDARIALGRALAARQFLVEQGVNGSKIRIASLAAGDFLAPARTDAGRALNRRVEIELVAARPAGPRQQSGQRQGAAP